MSDVCRVSFSVDRGGTFTDVFAVSSNGNYHILKLLSEDKDNYEDSTVEGIRRILEKETQRAMSGKIISSFVASIRMGTTVATNALLERKGEPFALLVTQGFKDILYIGNQSRPNIFDLKIQCPEVLYTTVVEVEERVVLKQESSSLKFPMSAEVKKCVTGEDIIVLKKLDEQKLISDLSRILQQGITCISVCLVHSYLYPDHEKRIKEIALSLGFKFVAISSEVMPMIKIVPRGLTTCADSYLTPHIKRYIEGFANGFSGDIKKMNVLFMQSDGGLTSVDSFSGSRAILSGPAGGVVGYAYTTLDDLGEQLPVIGFDMGGTSTDVSRFEHTFEHTYESITAGVAIQAPQLDIHTVAAGGGSKLFFRSGLFVVGPESSGAYPGPFCYRNGGCLSLTDANVVLGRVVPKYFPKIFGKQKNEAIDRDGTALEFGKLTEQINYFLSNDGNCNTKMMTVEEAAMGFVKVANEAMCRPIRSITQGKGFDTSKHILACFGGAGGQHCCAVAKLLGIETVFIHRFASILSAVGMALADVVHEEQQPAAVEYCVSNFSFIDKAFNHLKRKCSAELRKLHFDDSDIDFEYYLNLRYDRTDFAVMTRTENRCTNNFCAEGKFDVTFAEKYQREFGFTIPNRKILVDDIRVRANGRSNFQFEINLKSSTTVEAKEYVDCYFENVGFMKTAVYSINELGFGAEISGPAMLIDENNTVLVEPECSARITKKGNIAIRVPHENVSKVGVDANPIQLSIFSHRFMSIAEEMGKVLQRTAISTNIKERLDFSCALFGPDGGLVSNAPHIPVHLGAMQEAVQFQLKHLGNNIQPGDVILSNHPAAGGSHLPDLTVITPVFYKNSEKPVFFVANRGHHADIGGITPGSMPPQSTSLSEEGAAFISFKLVEKGVFQEEQICKLLTVGDNNNINFVGTRNLNDNISDLKAQIAGNQKGIVLVNRLIDQYGLDVVQAYMAHIQQNAEIAVRDMLKQIASNPSNCSLNAEDYMDDGTVINLHIEINKEDGSAIFDFTGTGVEIYGNRNTPKAITMSAIIYCLRCMVGYDVPLNQGCLKPITVIIPKGCLLWPSDEAAVVGGNVTTSQRVVDVILRAFGVCAASQGCMNNVTFGDSTVGYYETIAGGAGAGPSWQGRSGIHSHMTNTRITDVEIIEKRYPVIVQKFALNPGSGGEGLFKGGDGVIREILFRKQLVLSVLSERRVFAPYGLKGGKSGKRGLNLLQFKKGRIVNLGSKASVQVEPGDIFHIETPGGGGFGLQQ